MSERLRRKIAIAFYGVEVHQSRLMRDLDAHQRRMRTDPAILQRRDVERRELNRDHRWLFALTVTFLAATLASLALVLPDTLDVSSSAVFGMVTITFIALVLLLKRALLPASPAWALWTRYVAYEAPAADAPAAAAPWLWLLTWRVGRRATGYCRVVDAATGRTVYEWASARSNKEHP